jgi:predicted secreted protein
MPEIVVNVDENRRAIAVAVGDSLRIELPESPAAGFRWQMEPSSFEGVSALRLQSVDHQLEGREAGSGRRIFRFSAEAPGHATLRLELVRAWEGVAARETFVIIVDVR